MSTNFTKLLDSARDAFMRGAYHDALKTYTELAEKLKTNAFDANILIIKQRLNISLEKSTHRFRSAQQNSDDVGRISPFHYINQPERPSELASALRELGVEGIFIVNLPRRQDRKIKCLVEFGKHGLSPYFVEACDAKQDAAPLQIHSNFITSTPGKSIYSTHIPIERQKKYREQLSVGAFAYLLSQKKVIELARRHNLKRIAVFDDDVFFTDSSRERLSRLVKKDWKVVLLGASEYANAKELPPDVRARGLYQPIPGKTCGSFGMLYDNSIFEEILAAIEDADGTYDNTILGHFYNKYPQYCHVISPNICIPCVDESDIREGNREQESHSTRMQWDISNFKEWKRRLTVSIICQSLDSIQHIDRLAINDGQDLCVSIFYQSKFDGLRTLLPGRVCDLSKIDIDPLHYSSFNMIEVTNRLESEIPFCDMALLWPHNKVITDNEIRHACIDVLSGKNPFPVTRSTGTKSTLGRASIIIPSYRAIDEIWPSVFSALNQKYPDVEVIVVSDNPRRIDIGKKLEARYEQEIQSGALTGTHTLSVYQHKQNRHASAARNTGFLKSSGEYVFFLDDDDTFTPVRVTNAIAKFQTLSENYGAVYCGYQGAWNGALDMSRFLEGNLQKSVLLLRYSSHYMCTNTVAYRRSALLNTGLFNECYRRHQDLELSARFFNNFLISSTPTFDVKNRPTPVASTFDGDLDSLIEIKRKFLLDFRSEIQNLSSEDCDELISAHANDIIKRISAPTDREREIVKSFIRKIIKIN